ncbi:MAG: MBL fold metallo-hydrolase [Acidimicrobiia bacterium]
MDVRIVLLGTGTPRLDPSSSGPATALVVDGAPYLFDFGPGVAVRLSEAHHRGIAGMAMSGVTRAFLTHLHSDHTMGLPSLMLAPWMFGREEPLHVHGPLGTDRMVRHVAAAYEADVAKRRFSEPHTERGHEIEGHDLMPGAAFRDDRVTIEAFPVSHGDWVPEIHGPHPAFGYRVRIAAGPTIVISGDTGPFAAMEEAYRDCDVLVHEVYASRGLAARPATWQTYHRASHTSGTELGRIATLVQPGLLVVTHQLLWHADESDLLDEIAGVYDGDLAYGRDLDVF